MEMTPDYEDMIAEMQGNENSVINGDIPSTIALELKLIGGLLTLFFFLIFLICISWNHFADQIRPLYTTDPINESAPPGSPKRQKKDDISTVYDGLPTFFFEQPLWKTKDQPTRRHV